MSLHDPKFKYRTAAESKVPGYLAKRFAEIIKARKQNEQERLKVVAPIQQRRKA
jgi:uncharacterized protein (UPF0335 family)